VNTWGIMDFDESEKRGLLSGVNIVESGETRDSTYAAAARLSSPNLRVKLSENSHFEYRENQNIRNGYLCSIDRSGLTHD